MTDPFATKEVVEIKVSTDDDRHIPAGEYVGRLASFKTDVSRSGNDMIVWRFDVAEGPHENFPLWIRTVVNHSADWKAKKVANAVGLYNREKGVISLDPVAVDRRVLLTVQDSEYEGETRSELVDVNRHPDGWEFVDNADRLPF